MIVRDAPKAQRDMGWMVQTMPEQLDRPITGAKTECETQVLRIPQTSDGG